MPKTKPILLRQTPPPALRKGEMRKLEIIQATIGCLHRYGWAGTNYETVGQACGMKRPHVAYHFPEWDELIRSALRYAYSVGQAIVADGLRETKSPKEGLRAYIDGTFQWLRQHPELGAALTLLFHLAAVDKKYRRLNTEMKQVGVDRLEAMLAPHRKSSKHRRTAIAIHGLLVGRCLEVLSTDFDGDRRRIAEHTFEIAWELFSRSLA